MKLLLCFLMAAILGQNAFSTEAVKPPGAAGSTVFVWWEAENPKETTFKSVAWLKNNDQNKPSEELSGTDALTHYFTKKKGEDTKQFNFFAKWEVEVPKDGTYTLWSREVNKIFIQYNWRFDNDAWKLSDYDLPMVNPIKMTKYNTLGWINNGQVNLKKGKHIFEIQLTGSAHKGEGEHVWAVIDCFLLTTGEFTPNGKEKPR